MLVKRHMICQGGQVSLSGILHHRLKPKLEDEVPGQKERAGFAEIRDRQQLHMIKLLKKRASSQNGCSRTDSCSHQSFTVSIQMTDDNPFWNSLLPRNDKFRQTQRMARSSGYTREELACAAIEPSYACEATAPVTSRAHATMGRIRRYRRRRRQCRIPTACYPLSRNGCFQESGS